VCEPLSPGTLNELKNATWFLIPKEMLNFCYCLFLFYFPRYVLNFFVPGSGHGMCAQERFATVLGNVLHEFSVLLDCFRAF
jgi:hypothetical protein